eukprot:s400_g6.t1
MAQTEKVEMKFFDHSWPAVGAAGATGLASTGLQTQGEHGPGELEGLQNRHPWGKGQGQGTRLGRRQAERTDYKPTWQRSSDQAWDSWDQHGATKTALEQEVRQLRAELFSVQKLLLRHEDFMAGLKAELTRAMFLKMDMKATVVPALFAMQKKWREMKENTQKLWTQRMRVELIKALFKELSARLLKLPEQEDQMTLLKNLGWYEPETRDWSYVRWDSENERLASEHGREKVGYDKIAAVFESFQVLAGMPNAIVRFHPGRELVEKMTGRVLMFNLQMCIHGEASAQMRSHLALLTGLSITQLVGMSVRPERPLRSNLANAVQKQIQDYYG